MLSLCRETRMRQLSHCSLGEFLGVGTDKPRAPWSSPGGFGFSSLENLSSFWRQCDAGLPLPSPSIWALGRTSNGDTVPSGQGHSTSLLSVCCFSFLGLARPPGALDRLFISRKPLPFAREALPFFPCAFCPSFAKFRFQDEIPISVSYRYYN